MPIGANPPPGFFFSSRTTLSFGELKDDNGDHAGVDLNVKATVLQLLCTPGVTLWGGDYRAMALVPLVHLDQTIGAPFPPFLHGQTSGFGLGDVTISTFNLSWMVEPGIFWIIGTLINCQPASSIRTASATAPTPGAARSRSTRAACATAGTPRPASSTRPRPRTRRPATRRATSFLLNVTALRDTGGFSIGPVGYWRRQIEDDVNNGAFYGGVASGRAEQVGLGVGFSKAMGGGELNMNLVHDVMAWNTVGGTSLQISFSMPLGGKN